MPGDRNAHCSSRSRGQTRRSTPRGAKAEILELADVVKSLRLHWRVSVAIVLLTGVFFAVFVFTRNQVRPADRYEVGVQILVPTRDKAGKRPDQVPPSLLQGQATKALAQSTKDAALKAAKVPEAQRSSIGFHFSSGEGGDVITLSATANDPDIATKVALAFKDAYIATRRATIVNGHVRGAEGARNALGKMIARFNKVRKEIRAADVDLANSLPVSPGVTRDSPLNHLPVASTPLSTVLLVVEHQELLAKILSTEIAYAKDSTQALTPSSFAQTVETLGAEADHSAVAVARHAGRRVPRNRAAPGPRRAHPDGPARPLDPQRQDRGRRVRLGGAHVDPAGVAKGAARPRRPRHSVGRRLPGPGRNQHRDRPPSESDRRHVADRDRAGHGGRQLRGRARRSRPPGRAHRHRRAPAAGSSTRPKAPTPASLSPSCSSSPIREGSTARCRAASSRPASTISS